MNTIGGYTAPTRDHNYYIKHNTKWSAKFGDLQNKKPTRYID